MTRRVAITRAEPGASETAARVRAMGAEPVLAPLLSIESLAVDADVAGVQTLLFTSANGVRAFAAASAARGLAVLAVGDATADAARSAGFTRVQSADGDSAALEALSRATLEPGAGKVLHISGAHSADDITGALARAGFDAERRVAYQARAASVLPEVLHRPLDIVLFHSARAAETFRALGAPGSAGLIAACLSPAVAESAAQAKWARVIVAAGPRESDLLAAALAC